jgi:hypothetical protein
MNDEFKTETEILSDWNFIVTNGGQTIYDLTSGIKYRYHLSSLPILITPPCLLNVLAMSRSLSSTKAMRQKSFGRVSANE